MKQLAVWPQKRLRLQQPFLKNVKVLQRIYKRKSLLGKKSWKKLPVWPGPNTMKNHIKPINFKDCPLGTPDIRREVMYLESVSAFVM